MNSHQPGPIVRGQLSAASVSQREEVRVTFNDDACGSGSPRQQFQAAGVGDAPSALCLARLCSQMVYLVAALACARAAHFVGKPLERDVGMPESFSPGDDDGDSHLPWAKRHAAIAAPWPLIRRFAQCPRSFIKKSNRHSTDPNSGSYGLDPV